MKGKRVLRIDVCDYKDNPLCNLYDSLTNVSGNAVNVHIVTERNGWKEMSFSVPSRCLNEDGEWEDNFRLQFLRGEYRLRTGEIVPRWNEQEEKFEDVYEEDYYIISEPKINHNAFSKNVDVKAPHSSQALKSKNLDLEFSDEEGNNVGTAFQLSTTILEGSGWRVGKVETFKEDDGTTKVRSMKASANTGALSLIDQMCNLFDAKPIYHGKTRTVDIVSMNPFAKVDAGEIPQEILDGGRVIELHYDRSIHGLTKTDNTENMSTRLYAYGSYGDEVSGFVSLQTCDHNEYMFAVPEEESNHFYFKDDYGTKYYFAAEGLEPGQTLIWSDLDPASKMYIFHVIGNCAYKVQKTPFGNDKLLDYVQTDTVVNQVPYIMNFNYYEQVGLLTDEMLQDIAKYQRAMPEYARQIAAKRTEMNELENELTETAYSPTPYAKLAIDYTDVTTDKVSILRLDTTVAEDGVVYRTDYMEKEKDYFQWHSAKKLKTDGTPVDKIGSVIMIIHQPSREGEPYTWERSYIRHIYDRDGNEFLNEEGEPGYFDYKQGRLPYRLELWNEIRWSLTDDVFLFNTNSMSGQLGVLFSQQEAIEINIKDIAKVGGTDHPVYIWPDDIANPPPTDGINYVTPDPEHPWEKSENQRYGWWYKFNQKDRLTPGEYYFCWGTKGDISWHRMYVQDAEPTALNGDYWIEKKTAKFYHKVSGAWELYDITLDEYRNMESYSTSIYNELRRLDQTYEGFYEEYVYPESSSANIPIGKYAFQTDFGSYWVFTTDREVNGRLILDTSTNRVWQDTDAEHIVGTEYKPAETIFYPKANEFEGLQMYSGKVDKTTAIDDNDENWHSNNLTLIYESTTYEYSFPNNSQAYIMFWDSNSRIIKDNNVPISIDLHGTGRFITPANTHFYRVCVNHDLTGCYIRMRNYDQRIIVRNVLNDTIYTVLNATGQGNRTSINALTALFAQKNHEIYEAKLPEINLLQNRQKEEENNLAFALGDILKDGRWYDSNYVAGDEKRLLKDAMDMLDEISMPETTYDFTYIDLYGANHDMHFYEDTEDVEWPDIFITDAAHLVDPEIKVNCWAYIDKIDKCYDKPWETSVEINTQLKLDSRHEFTDMLARIAQAAKDTKVKSSVYDRAKAINADGTLATDRLEGAIVLGRTELNGMVSGLKTDSNGNFIFESADGQSAMILGGRGLGIANSKNKDGDWEWRQCATGYGLTADAIYTGYLSAARIEAGTISVDKLMSNVGQTLDIGSNKALALYATADGSRPAGALRTTDAQIIITAGYVNTLGETVPAKIDIASGGELNLNGSAIHISSSGTLDLQSGGTFSLKSGTGTTDIDHVANNGLYIGNDGINLGNGKFLYKNGANAAIKVGGKIEIVADDTIDVLAGKVLTLETNGTITIGKTGTSLFQIGSMTIGNNTYAYILNGMIGGLNDTTNNGIYLGTDGIALGAGKFKATADGTIYVEGQIKATSGEIAGWTIDGTKLKSGNVGLDSNPADTNNVHIWAGSTLSSTADFRVYRNGKLYAKNIQADGGTVAGWDIDTTSITNGLTGIAEATNLNDIAIWSGGEKTNKVNAFFKVRKDGIVFAPSIHVDQGGVIVHDENYNGTTIYSRDDCVFVADHKGVYVKRGLIGSWTVQDDCLICIDNTTGTETYKVQHSRDYYRYVQNGSTISIDTVQVYYDNYLSQTAPVGLRCHKGTNPFIWAGNSARASTSTWSDTYNNSIFCLKGDGTGKWSGFNFVQLVGSPSLGQINCANTGCDFYVNSNGTGKWSYITFNANAAVHLGNLKLSDGGITDSGNISTANLGFSNGSTVFWSGGARATAPFMVDDQGKGMWSRFYFGSDYIGNADTLANSRYGLCNPETYDYTTIVLWVGDTYSSGAAEFRVQRNGKVIATNLDTTSSREYKRNIKDLRTVGNIIDRLNPVEFVYNKDKRNRTRFGLIYEDTINVLPEICDDEGGTKTLSYLDLIPILLKEIQDLRKRVKILEG